MTRLLASGLAGDASAGVMLMLLHRLFLEPIPLDRYWLVLLMPLIMAVCVVYKTIKLEDMSRVPKIAAVLMLQIMIFMVAVGAVLWLIVRFVS